MGAIKRNEITDYSKPIEFLGLIPKQVPTANGFVMQIMEFRVAIDFKEVIGVEELVEHWLFPQDSREKVNMIVRGRGGYTIISSFDEVFAMWTNYKDYLNKKSVILN